MTNLLKNNYCNSGKLAPGWRNLLFSHISKKYFLNFYSLRKAIKIIRKSNVDQINSEIRSLLVELRSKSLQSAYSNYYEQKNENFSVLNPKEWNDKQKSINSILEAKKPKTLIDIGANTGWFSMLALKHGALVYALDNDCASLDIAYRNTVKRGLIPFRIDFDDIWKQANRVSTSFNERYCVDMVLALGLVHHLVLGKGISIEVVMQRLSSLTKESLVIEFVELDDEKIQNEASFFGSLKLMSSKYSEAIVIEQGLRYFSYVETLPSTPSTRRILTFTRREYAS
jgi:precorrin-6B methylase 2